MNRQCYKGNKCRLFLGKIDLSEHTRLMYNCSYCLGLESKWRNCKRFLLLETEGFCPDFVMPNTLLSDEQIMKRVGLETSLIH